MLLRLRPRRREAAAVAELIEAERASKFAAEAEARALSESLEATQQTLEREREVARKVGNDLRSHSE